MFIAHTTQTKAEKFSVRISVEPPETLWGKVVGKPGVYGIAFPLSDLTEQQTTVYLGEYISRFRSERERQIKAAEKIKR